MFSNEVIIFSFINNYLKLGRKFYCNLYFFYAFPHNNRLNLNPSLIFKGYYTIYGDIYIIQYDEDKKV